LLGNNGLPTEGEFLLELRKQSRLLFEKELKDMGCWLVRFQRASGIIKCSFREKETVILLLRSLKSIGSNQVEIITERTSGTIRGVSHQD
jgi:RNase P/RNase MRP subunit POP5